ncbi:MAG TPA: Rab family GTPase [Aggregatilineales bacterium]|nr:GTP-binding protein [Anaerolineales bacterium]HRE47086.1 Rab family GTPase [Aggregatilineales bacterium]
MVAARWDWTLSDLLQPQMDNAPVFKITLIGAERVGKSLLVTTYINELGTDFRHVSEGTDLRTTVVNAPRHQAQITLWDMAGRDRYHRLRDQIFVGAHAVALIYDVTSPSSFFDLMSWRDTIQGIAPRVPMIVIGNKIDLPTVVPPEEVRGWSEANGLTFWLTSAVTGEGVMNAFEHLSDIAALEYKRRGAGG